MVNQLNNIRLLSLGAGLALLGLLPASAQTPDPSDTTYVRFNTTLGNIDVLLLTHEAPLNVANFMSYVNNVNSNSNYATSFFHRTISGFILQGGNYKFTSGNLTALTANAPVAGEHGASNTNAFSNARGTLALALSTGPDSGTTSWFFNLVDNNFDGDAGGNNLDGSTGGGPFTVFGVVANSSSLAVMDAIAAVPVWNFGDPFATLPLSNYTTAQYHHAYFNPQTFDDEAAVES